MKKISSSYHFIKKATALLLLMAFLIPSGLHAKQLVDFCLMEKAPTEMAADHSCCESESNDNQADADNHQHHDCDWGFICACSIGESALGNSNWVLSSTDFEIILTDKENLTPFLLSSERVPASQNKQLAQHDPPLWLVYDTFLN